MTEYKCPKCGMMYDNPGKCDMCDVELKKVKGKEQEHPGKKYDHKDHHKMMMKDFRKRFFISLILTVPILLLSPLIQGFFGFEFGFPGDIYLLFVLSAAAFFYGGWPFLTGIVSELKEKQPGMMTLIALAITVAFAYSSAVVFGLKGKLFFWELVTLIDVMLLGHWLEMRSVIGASKALEKLSELLPDKAHLIKDGDTEDVDVSELKKGDKILIKPGEKVPADGIIVKGKGSVDESMLTGESKPVKKKKGDKLIGGSVNKDSSFEIKIKETGKDTYLSKVIRLVDEAQKSKSKTQKLADKAAMWLTVISITVGVSTLIVWLFFEDLAFAIERMATVMVITCPHALGLAIPLVVAVSTSLSAKNGLLIRNRTAFEQSRKIDTIVFDKTGTLTEGKFGVKEIIPAGDKYKKKEIIRLAASLEKESEHPIAEGIVDRAKKMKAKTSDVEGFSNIKGEGVKGKVYGKNIKVVSPSHLKKNNIDIPENLKDKKTGTIVYVLLDKKVIGSIVLGDSIRKESNDAIRKLQEEGMECMMLTGDNKETAKEVSEELGLDGYFAEILPDEKQKKIKKLQKEGKFVAMTGDGVNDAPALAQADVGIAIGSGTDVAAETADIVLVESNPQDITSLILFGKATYNKMLQNIFWATGYNVIVIPLAAGVLYFKGILISPALGAALMSLSTIIVAVNAKLLRVKRP
ncbi:copper-translocating P-type ATPase [Candidatus Woesearchaeota archaeon]|nr:copper-translocating P-type ATPase [Candidatus Woesearchaeota archaeon]